MRDLSKLALIYSHNGYWRKNQSGYTNDISRAGIYEREEAEKIAAGCGPEKGVQLCPVNDDHPVIVAEERDELRVDLRTMMDSRDQALANLEVANGQLKRGERCIGKLREIAQSLGWNGVDNSKILEEFLDGAIVDLRAQVERLRQSHCLQEQVSAEMEAGLVRADQWRVECLAATSRADAAERELKQLLASRVEVGPDELMGCSIGHETSLYRQGDGCVACRITARAEAAEKLVAGLRRALEEACPDEPMVQDEQGGCVWCGGYPDGRPLSMPKHKDHHKDCGWLIGRAALADTPDTFERKIQADALEEIANLIRQTTPDGRSNSNYDRGMFNGRYRAIEQIETAVKELRSGDGMQAVVTEDVANEAVAVGMGVGAPPGGAPTAYSELLNARQAAVYLAKKVATLRTAIFEIRQHAAPSGIESGDLAIEAVAIQALKDTEVVEKTQPGPDAAQLLEWYSKNDTLLGKLQRSEGSGLWCFFDKKGKSHSRDAEGNQMDFPTALRKAWEAHNGN